MERARSILIDKLSSTFIEELKGEVDEIYLVGGAIRDAFFGKVAKDFDFVLSENAFEKTLKFLEKKHIRYFTLNKGNFLSIRAIEDGLTFDFTKIANNIKYDLLLRDYTINAIYYSIKRNKFFYNDISLNDLKKRILRVISPSSISYDPLRSLRGIRLAATFDLSIDETTKEKIRNGFSLLHTVKKERRREETKKILNIDINSLIKVLKLFFPERDFSVAYKKCRVSKEFEILNREINKDFTYRDALTVALFSQALQCNLANTLGLTRKEREIVEQIMKEKVVNDFDSLFSIFVRYREIFIPLCIAVLSFDKKEAIKIGTLIMKWSKIKFDGNKLKMQYNVKGKALGKLKERLLKNECRRLYEEV